MTTRLDRESKQQLREGVPSDHSPTPRAREADPGLHTQRGCTVALVGRGSTGALGRHSRSSGWSTAGNPQGEALTPGVTVGRGWKPRGRPQECHPAPQT